MVFTVSMETSICVTSYVTLQYIQQIYILLDCDVFVLFRFCSALVQMPRNIFEEMKYLEIMIVADHNTVGLNFLTQNSFSRRIKKKKSASFKLCTLVFFLRIRTEIVHQRALNNKCHIMYKTIMFKVGFQTFDLFFLQFKRHKSKKHTRNSAKSVVNLVDAVCFHICIFVD